MLGFLRKHQKYFWILITIVIVISFSFFGTYNTIQERTIADPIVFKTIDGNDIHQSDLEEMVKFLATDNEDKQWLGGMWGPNFLNDGVIKNDFIQTGLAEILAASYLGEMKADLDPRFQKEKRYHLYENSQVKFISVTNVWKYFYPEMLKNFEELQNSDNAATPEAFKARVDLFKGQRSFPPYALRQALRYQEQQFKWVNPDPALQRLDLSLFGYHTVEDWFGPKFVRLVSSFIINSSIIAQERGYAVSKEEAYADLVKNAEISFEQNKTNPNLGVATSSEYISEQIRRMGMDLGRAIAIWQKVLEFRRLFNEQANSVFLDAYSVGKLNEYAQVMIEGELYNLPEGMIISDFNTLQEFEIYLNAVAKVSEGSLELPQTFFSGEEVSKQYPELVQKRYYLEMSTVDNKDLQGKVSVKDTWNWEVEDANWNKLKKEFPDIGVKKGETREERVAALDSLDSKTRGRVDNFAREAIVEAHPEWVQEALNNATMVKKEVAIRLKGGKPLIPGVKDSKDLMALLDGWPASKEKLAMYTSDKDHFYKIQVIQKSPGLEVLTFSEAEQDGTLAELLKIQPKKDYSKLLEAIRQNYAKANPADKNADKMVEDYAATLRFYQYVSDVKNKISKNATRESQYVREEESSPKEIEGLKKREALADQWKLVKKKYSVDRGSENPYFEFSEVMTTPVNSFSKTYPRRNGEIVFFKMEQVGKSQHKEDLLQGIYLVQRLLGTEAEGILMKKLLVEFKDKKAMYIQ
jgi:GcvH upstream region-like protein